MRAGLVIATLAGTVNVDAQSGPTADAAEASPIPIAGLRPPVAPAVITRDDAGRATLRAIRLSEPLHLDGQLDESLYEVPAIADFIQVEPHSGAPATEKTEVWISFDDDNVYVSFRNWESRLDTLVANEMRRDSTNITMGNDNIAFLLDTPWRSSTTSPSTAIGRAPDRRHLERRHQLSCTTRLQRGQLWRAGRAPRRRRRVQPGGAVSALVQYNSGTRSASTNVRLRWEYRRGSELFVVYNDDRNTLKRGFPDLSTRAFIVKVNRLLRP